MTWKSRSGWHPSDDGVGRSEWLQNGFVDPDDVTLDWDDSTLTLTVSPSGTSYDYYIQGIKCTEYGELTATISGNSGLYAIYFNSEGLISHTRNPTHTIIDTIVMTKCSIAFVYWNAVTEDGRVMTELHGMQMSPRTHEWIHNHIGAVYEEGLALIGIYPDGGGTQAWDAYFGVAEGECYDEDLELEYEEVANSLGLEIWYRTEGGVWAWDAAGSGYSVKSIGGAGTRLAYNSTYTQADAGQNNFVLCHVFATNILGGDGADECQCIAIQGQAAYATLKLARAGADTEINNLAFGTLPLEEIVPIATVIFKTSTSFSNAKKAITVSTESGDDYVDWRGSGLKASGGNVHAHDALSGLEDNDHPQYLLVADIDDTAVNAEVAAPISSNWAFDHDADATAHHSNANDHAAAHTVVSHSDTTATGAELETLTDGSVADSLHSHTGGGAEPFHTSVIYPDDDWDSEAIPLFQPPEAITITKVIATVMGAAAGADLLFNIEPRTNVNTANAADELFASDQIADKDGISLTSFVTDKDDITAEDHLVLTTPTDAEDEVVDCLIITIYYEPT